jgi:uncharacterized protein YciI
MSAIGRPDDWQTFIIRGPMLGDGRLVVNEKEILMVGTKTFMIISAAGPNRDLAKGTREQRYWDEHAAFIDGLVEAGFIVLGGPLSDEGGAVLVVQADDEGEVREKLKDDPWYVNGILRLERVTRWEIFIDERR